MKLLTLLLALLAVVGAMLGYCFTAFSTAMPFTALWRQ